MATPIDPLIALRTAPLLSLTCIVESGPARGSVEMPSPQPVPGGSWQQVTRIGLAGYRIEGKAVQSRSWRWVILPQAGIELAELRLMIAEYAVVRMDVRGDADRGHLMLTRLFGRVTDDAELNAIAERFRRHPKFYDDPTFGRFEVEYPFDLEGTIDWAGRKIDLRLNETYYPANLELLAEALATARALGQNQRGWDQRVRDFAVAELLDDCADWRDQGHEELTAEQFSARMTLSGIHIHPGGSFGFWFDCDDLFSDHVIQVRGTLTDGAHAAHIEG